jgi:hypothetical protein
MLFRYQCGRRHDAAAGFAVRRRAMRLPLN